MTTEDVRLVGMQAVVGVVLDHDSLAAHQHLSEMKQSLAAQQCTVNYDTST